jgi:hypothetical protein
MIKWNVLEVLRFCFSWYHRWVECRPGKHHLNNAYYLNFCSDITENLLQCSTSGESFERILITAFEAHRSIPWEGAMARVHEINPPVTFSMTTTSSLTASAIKQQANYTAFMKHLKFDRRTSDSTCTGTLCTRRINSGFNNI